MKECPVPSKGDISYGYAGGIGPTNVKDILNKVEQASRGIAVWIDMESSLRVKVVGEAGDIRDVFSFDRCFSCITTAVQSFVYLLRVEEVLAKFPK
jgi:hypothetical protein